jgi:alkaline phosphatase D
VNKPVVRQPLTRLLNTDSGGSAGLRSEGRRHFVSGVALGAAALGLGLTGCGGGSDPEVRFAHGVASGDPLADRVILSSGRG